VVANLSDLHLDHIENPEVLSERVKDITKDFHKEIKDFKDSKIGRSVKRWTPLIVSGIATIAGAAIGVPEVTISGAFTTVTISIVQEGMLSKSPETEREKVVKLLAGIQNDIVNEAEIKRLI
jgi:hypothetical protein